MKLRRRTGAVASGVLGASQRTDRAASSSAGRALAPPERVTVDHRPRGDANEVSLDDLLQWVRIAICDAYETADDCDGPWIAEIYVDSVIFELDGKCFRVGYTVDLQARSVTLTGEAVEVQREWVTVTPAPPAAPPLPASPLDDATNSRRRIRVDFVAPIHTDPRRDDGILATPDPSTGFLTLDGRLTRTGVFVYRDGEGHEWGELRTDEEVFAPEALDSFKSVVVTNDHPSSFVDVRNVRDVQVGHVGSEVRRDGDFVRAPITVTDAATIALIMAGKKELSCGYTAECVADTGELGGQRYDQRQTTIRGNHVAIVDVGRAGPDCALLSRGDGAAVTVTQTFASPPPRKDGASTPPPTEQPMKLDKMIKDALEALKNGKADEAKKLATQARDALKEQKSDAATEQAQAAIELLTKGLEMGDEMLMELVLEKTAQMLSGAAPAEPPSNEPEPSGDADPAPAAAPGMDDADAVKLRARVDALEAQRKKDRETEAARIDARVKLVADARSVVTDLDPTGKSDSDIMRAVVLAVDPEAGAKLDAHKDRPGYLEARFEDALDLADRRERHADELAGALFGARADGGAPDPDAARADFLKRRDERSKNARAAS